MAPRFDSENLTLDLSVADLLDAPLLRSLGFSSRGGYERLWLGQAIHGRYQEQQLKENPLYRRGGGVLFPTFPPPSHITPPDPPARTAPQPPACGRVYSAKFFFARGGGRGGRPPPFEPSSY